MQIETLLVANRGEIASRIMRSAHARGCRTVAVYSDADADMPFVAEADVAVRLPGVTPAETYLDVEAILRAAALTGADAVHPGYGFLSENEGFARACAEAGLVFVGPSPEAIAAMGSKIRAKELMAEAGVPVLPSVVVDESADLDSLAERVVEEVGLPALVKASFGGGGRGMRIVRSAEEVEGAVRSATSEAASAFGSGAVFIERYVERPRHIEVQILGDDAGTVVALFERECSIQRRYQKIIEEAPSPAVDPELRSRLCTAAVAAGATLAYRGAGTVEFIVDDSGEFFFLEVNTRLQVEHPVTEMVTGLDLVDLQLRVAEGESLDETVTEATIKGHAIEVRLYAEDVAAGFLPASGPVHLFEVPTVAGVRVDAGVATGSVVGVNYDSMLAKVIAHGSDRDLAIRRLRRTLAQARVHGVTTNRSLLLGILGEREFQAGAIDTGYLDRHDPVKLMHAGRDPDSRVVHAVAAVALAERDRRQRARVVSTMPSGWRNARSAGQESVLGSDEQDVVVSYRMDGDHLLGDVDGKEIDALVRHRDGSGLVVEWGGRRVTCQVHRIEGWCYVDSPLGSDAFKERPRFSPPSSSSAAGSLLAPMPATVLEVGVSEGDDVDAGQMVVVLEAMKMEHTVVAPSAGHVREVLVTVGSQIDGGAVLAVIDDEGAQ